MTSMTDAAGIPLPARDMREPRVLAAGGISWGAVLAGAAGAAALSLILLILGTGLGLSSISPWASEGASAKAIGTSTIAWITVTSVLASGMGGYLAGRLRTRWTDIHVDEIHFRDTAHGFLAWSVATLATAALLGSVVSTVVGGGIKAGASVAGGMASGAGQMASAHAGPMDSAGGRESNATGYFVDSLFRRDATAGATTPDPQSRGAADAEVTRIFARAAETGSLQPDDSHYLGTLVAQRTGLSQADAEKRVTDTYSRMQDAIHQGEDKAQQAAEAARKASAYASLWLFISLLIGAFIASFSAIYGGRHGGR